MQPQDFFIAMVSNCGVVYLIYEAVTRLLGYSDGTRP